MDPLATVADLGAWLDETLTDSTRAAAVLDHASSLVRTEAHDSFAVTVPDGIPQLTVRVAARMWLNPSGLKSSTTGPFSGTFGDMELTDSEKAEIWQIMHPAAPVRRGLCTISTTRGPISPSITYVDVVGSDQPMEVSREPW